MLNKRITVLTWRDRSHKEAGGAEEYIINLVTKLKERKYDITILTASYPGAKKDEIVDGIVYHRRGGTYSQYIVIPLYFLLVIKAQTDVLIENFNAWPYLSPFLHKKHLVIIHHMQDIEWINRFGKILGNILLLISRTLLSFYKHSKIITVSQSTKDELTEKGYSDKNMTLAFNGISNDFFQTPTIRQKASPVRLLFLGRQARTKRTLFGLQIINRYRELHPDIQLQVDIIGIGEALPDIQKFSERTGLPVKIHGRVSDSEKIAITTQSHLQIQLAQKEGWGITTIEAASRGVPTLCLNVPGLRDSVLPTTGYIAQNETQLLPTLEQAILEIATNSANYLEKKQRASEWSRQFTWENCAFTVEKVLESL